MRVLRAPARPCDARYTLAAVAVALFGLLSMHGWGSHTGTHPMEAKPPSANAMITASHPGGHHHSGPAATEPNGSAQVVAVHPTARDSEEPGESGAGLVALCLAVMTGLVLGVALLLARRGVRIPRRLLPAWPSQVVSGRDRDPPDLDMLCVLRC